MRAHLRFVHFISNNLLAALTFFRDQYYFILNLRPRLAKDIKAAGFGLVWFLPIIDYAFSYRTSAVKLLAGPKSDVAPPWQITNARVVAPPKIHHFLSSLSKHKKSEKTVISAFKK